MVLYAPAEIIWSSSPYGAMLDSNANGDATWPVANEAVYQWLWLPLPRLIKSLFVVNGTGVSGNFDIGLYDHTGRQLVHTGSTAQAGTSNLQHVTITPLLIGPGSFMVGLAFDNTSGHVRAGKNGSNYGFMSGVHLQTSAFPLPNPAVLGSGGFNFSPFCGISCRGF